MAITLTLNYLLSKFEKYDIDWNAGVNQNFDDLDLILTRLDLRNEILHVQHTTAAGTDGGDLNITWTTRPLNTTMLNTVTGGSVGANQVTLPAGTYWVEGRGEAYSCDNHRCRVYDVTNTADLLVGLSARAKVSYLDASYSSVVGRIVLTAETVIELQHICQTAKTASGLGKNTNLDSKGEIYGELIFRREAI